MNTAGGSSNPQNPSGSALVSEVARRRRELDGRRQAGGRGSSPTDRAARPGRLLVTPDQPQLERAQVQPDPSASGSTHVGHLLPLHGRAFVDAAYRAILDRPMDAAGDSYVAFLLAGGPKARVLRSLLDSSEAKQRGATLQGFGPLRLFDRLTSLPILGYPIRWLWTLATLPRIVRLANHAQQDAVRRIEALAAVHNRNVDDLQTSVGHAGSGIDPELEDRVAAVEARTAELAPRMAAFFDELDAAQPDLDVDALYTAFEDRFRGSSDSVAEKQRQYLDVIRAAGAGTPDRPVLDLGCGRGEWLQLLRDEDLVAEGVDVSPTMTERCRQAGLDVRQAQGIDALRTALPATYGAVTGFHVIEHMPASWQIRFLELAFRALKPGGVAIFETPNPEHLPVGALRFYVDPTHVRPLPSALVDFLAEHIGFVDREIRYLWPADDDRADLHGWSVYQDYALIARRPSADGAAH